MPSGSRGKGATRKDWQSEARLKVDAEGRCRFCLRRPRQVIKLEAAHTVGQKHQDVRQEDGTKLVKGDAVIPLCLDTSGGCHGLYDAHRLDIYDLLTKAEWANAVEAVGEERAYRITSAQMNVEGALT